MPSRARCDRCGQTSTRTAFVDESVRGSNYLMAAALVCTCEIAEVRRLVKQQRRSGQSRIHFCKMGNPARAAFLAMIATRDVRIVSAAAQGRRRLARSTCLSDLAPMMAQRGAQEIVIETADGLEHQDRADLRRALTGTGVGHQVRYRHATASSEPLLWIADAAAWSLGRGGPWVERLGPLIG